MMTDHDYQGPASLVIADTEIPVEVVLRGHFQPIDGRYHWYGRITANTELDTLAPGHRSVTLRTPQGGADGVLSQPDLWRRYRISGTGRPPFALASPG
jgi:hypothetical protein